jgi:hypothetical protein
MSAREERSMELSVSRRVSTCVACWLFLTVPLTGSAQTDTAGPPPVGVQTVREGDFAVQLLFALGAGTTDDEVEAESGLGEIGIAPRNGWIADYPVTPDIVGELENSVVSAADSRKLKMSRDEAVKRFRDLSVQLGLAVTPYTGAVTNQPPTSAGNYPNPEDVSGYYAEEGPPVVTYYAPPPDYYYLYGFVPYPFWCYGFWFPGFYILHDFYRPIFVHNRVGFISNHFNDIRAHRVFRVDPLNRFNGRTFAGIGIPRSKGFISTGVPRSDRRVFNAPRERAAPGMAAPPFRGRMAVPQYRGQTVAPQRGGPIGPQFRGGEMAAPSRGGMSAPPARGGSGSVGPSSRGGGGFSRGGGHGR